MAPTNPKPPSPYVVLMMYLVFGSLVSFLGGRKPGTPPEDVYRELAPITVVFCIFLVSYSLWDVMGTGVAKEKAYNHSQLSYKDLPPKPPANVYCAQRVQTNQVEQMPGFLVASMSCAYYVNGTVAGVMALAWVVLRRIYASVYRNSNGAPLAELGLAMYTVPAYMILNAMLMSAAIQIIRAYL